MNLHNPTNLKLQCRVWCKSQTWYFCPDSFTSYLISQQRRAEVIFTGDVFASPLARYLIPALPPRTLPNRLQERHLPLRPKCQAGLVCALPLHLPSPSTPVVTRPPPPSLLDPLYTRQTHNPDTTPGPKCQTYIPDITAVCTHTYLSTSHTHTCRHSYTHSCQPYSPDTSASLIPHLTLIHNHSCYPHIWWHFTLPLLHTLLQHSCHCSTSQHLHQARLYTVRVVHRERERKGGVPWQVICYDVRYTVNRKHTH